MDSFHFQGGRGRTRGSGRVLTRGGTAPRASIHSGIVQQQQSQPMQQQQQTPQSQQQQHHTMASVFASIITCPSKTYYFLCIFALIFIVLVLECGLEAVYVAVLLVTLNYLYNFFF